MGGAPTRAVGRLDALDPAPLRARRALFATEPGLVTEILAAGNARANELADATLRDVRELMGMTYC